MNSFVVIACSLVFALSVGAAPLFDPQQQQNSDLMSMLAGDGDMGMSALLDPTQGYNPNTLGGMGLNGPATNTNSNYNPMVNGPPATNPGGYNPNSAYNPMGMGAGNTNPNSPYNPMSMGAGNTNPNSVYNPMSMSGAPSGYNPNSMAYPSSIGAKGHSMGGPQTTPQGAGLFKKSATSKKDSA